MDVVLALGGGGAKCFAQIGALRALVRAGVRVRAVACTSAGGLVGAPFAAGVTPDELLALLAAVRAGRPRRARRGAGLFDPAGALAFLDDLLGARRFDELALPLALTAVDLETGAPVALRQGSVRDALHAAVAVPGLFPPVRHGGRLLVDGGVVDPVPVALARALLPGPPAVAVVVAPPLGRGSEHPLARRLDGAPVLRRLARFRPLRALEVFVRAGDLSHRRLMTARLALDRPELVIRPVVPPLDLFAPADVDALVRAGEAATERALARLARLRPDDLDGDAGAHGDLGGEALDGVVAEHVGRGAARGAQ